MNKLLIIVLGVIVMSATILSAQGKVVTGLENLLRNHLNLIEGKRLGVIANQTSVDSNGEHIIDLLSKHAKVAAAFGPEHGIKGDNDDAIEIQDTIESGLRIYSIYGSFRAPTPEMLRDIDVLIYDVQDVGVKFYTYISSLFLAMGAAKRDGIPVIVLDRPNPIRADRVEGPITTPPHHSFVGVAPLPTRYGMTVGEIAEMFNNEDYLGFSLNCNLTVIKMKNYSRDMWYDETGLPWIATSPNMPDLETATVYPGMCLFEGTNFSEGRGTPSPFLMIGAPYIDAEQWLKSVPKKYLKGVKVKTVEFTPHPIPGKDSNPKHDGSKCSGLKLTVTNRDQFEPIPLAVALLSSAQKLYPKEFQTSRRLDRLWGNEDLRALLHSNIELENVIKIASPDNEHFLKVRKKYLLYK
jgi:uncharacterized protein YbbC (DUF1343 family)